MNKSIKRIVSAALAFAAVLSLAACSGSNSGKTDLQADGAQANKTEIALVSEQYKKLADGDENSSEKIPVGEEVVLNLKESGEVNTVALREKGSRCESFSIYGENSNGERITLYENDIIDDYLYCAFDSAEITKLIFKVNKSEKNKDVKISDIQAFNVENKADNGFRVTAYYPVDQYLPDYFSTHVNDEALSKNLDIATDIIIIGSIRFDRNGDLIYNKEKLDLEISSLKQTIGDRDTRIWCCVLNPKDEEGKLSNKDSVYAIKHNLDKLNNNLLELCKTYGFCGIDFDWEYPRRPLNWNAYNKLLVSLGEKLHENGFMLSSALGPWGNMMSKEAKESLDFVNVMSYDWSKNKRNYHSEFYTAHYFSAEYFLKHGFKKEQLILGVPFYGNSLDDGEYAQAGYNDIEANSKSQNVGTRDGRPYYYNGYNLIYSKTAYANDMEFAGVMTWHGAIDKEASSGISLFEAMEKAQSDRAE